MSTLRRATIDEIAHELGISPYTVKFYRGQDQALWATWEIGVRPKPGRGRPQKEYDLDKVVAHYGSAQTADIAARWPDMDEIVDLATIGERLGLNATTVASYPTLYGRSSNPFPPKVARGQWRWGDIVAWQSHRRGSGRREPRTPDSGVDPGEAKAHLAQLIRSGLPLREIAQVSEVPMRTLQRLHSGELERLSPDYETALLTVDAEQGRAVRTGADSALARLPIAYRATPVTALGLPTRTSKALEEAGIRTAGRLATATDEHLATVKGLGPAGRQAISSVRMQPPIDQLTDYLANRFADLGSSVPALASELGIDPQSCLELPPVADHIIASVEAGESTRSIARRCEVPYGRLAAVLQQHGN